MILFEATTLFSSKAQASVVRSQHMNLPVCELKRPQKSRFEYVGLLLGGV